MKNSSCIIQFVHYTSSSFYYSVLVPLEIITLIDRTVKSLFEKTFLVTLCLFHCLLSVCLGIFERFVNSFFSAEYKIKLFSKFI